MLGFGESKFEFKGQTYKWKFGQNARCEVEERLGCPIGEVVAELGSWADKPELYRATLLRAVFWSGLQERHPEIDLRAAGQIMDEIGIDKVIELFLAAFPSASNADDAGTKGQDPTKGAPTLTAA